MAALSCLPSSRRARDVPEMCPRRLGRPSKRIPASQEPPLRAFPLWEGGFAQGNPSKTSVKPPLTPTGETTRPGHMPAPSGGGGLAGRDGDGVRARSPGADGARSVLAQDGVEAMPKPAPVDP